MLITQSILITDAPNTTCRYKATVDRSTTVGIIDITSIRRCEQCTYCSTYYKSRTYGLFQRYETSRRRIRTDTYGTVYAHHTVNTRTTYRYVPYVRTIALRTYDIFLPLVVWFCTKWAAATTNVDSCELRCKQQHHQPIISHITTSIYYHVEQ